MLYAEYNSGISLKTNILFYLEYNFTYKNNFYNRINIFYEKIYSKIIFRKMLIYLWNIFEELEAKQIQKLMYKKISFNSLECRLKNIFQLLVELK